MFKTPLLITIAMGSISVALAAPRIVDQPEGSYELALAEVTMPRSITGMVAFKSCETCRTTALRVSGRTRYSVNGSEVAYGDFSEQLEDLRDVDDRSVFVGVYYDLETNFVTRVSVIDMSD